MSSRRRPSRRGRQIRKAGGRTSRKLVGLFLIVILALVGLAGRITYINVTQGEKYSRIVLSQAQQRYESRTIPFRRGDILDRNGTILATSEKVYNVILDCKVVNDSITTLTGEEEKRYYEPTIKALKNVLHIRENEVRALLDGEETRDSQYQILAQNISITEKKAFEAYCDLDSEENKDLTREERKERLYVQGVWFEDTWQRVYPLDSLACDTIGFTYADNQADWGIEGYYSDILSGVNGRQYGYYNEESDVEQNIIPAKDGKNVVSTLDANIQQIIRTVLEDFNQWITQGQQGVRSAQNVGILVMDPNNGEILGMDSLDWYDLNNPRDLTPFYSKEDISKMSDEDVVNNLNAIWRNYCISDTYEPGSTIKPITVAAGLETGAIKTDETFYCDGAQHVVDTDIHCTDTHGAEDIEEALKYSCNDALMQIADLIGGSELIRYQKLFNFGRRTGVDLPGEGEGVLFSEESMGPVELATASFGQGITCTMIQHAAAFSAIINGGNYYKPHVVSQITDSTGSVVSTIEPTVEKRVVSQSVSTELRRALASVCEPGGTGYRAKVDGYSMGGKTGTAQKIPRSAEKYVVSFAGYVPVENPQVLVYVVVDEPNTAEQDSSIYASAVAKQVFTELLPYLNIFPDQELTGNEADDDSDEKALADMELPEPQHLTGADDTSAGEEETEAAEEISETDEESGETGGTQEETEETYETDDAGSEEDEGIFSEGLTNEEQALTE